MKLNENGQYIANSFAISSFAWAACTLVREGSISAKLDAAELEKLQHAWNDALLQRQKEVCEPAFSKEKLLVLFGEVCGGLGVADGLLKSALWAREKKQHANKKGEFPPLDPSTELLQSFYLKDMEAIRKAPTKTVSVYVQAMVEPVPKAERVQIDTDTEQMRRWLRADAFPLGAWPSQYSPSPVSYTHLREVLRPSDGTVRVAGHVHGNAVRAVDAAPVQLLREQPCQYGGPDRAYARCV